VSDKCKICLLPWSHLFYGSDGNVYPCCKLEGKNSKYVVGKSTDSVDTLWNSPVLKELRKSFMEQKITDACNTQCFNSINSLNIYVSQADNNRKEQWFSETAPDGTFRKNFTVWNLVASNLCNYKCAYCSILLSSRFYEDKDILSVIPKHSSQREITQQHYKAFESKEQMLKLFKENIDMIEKIYFAGGETHLQDGYNEMFEMLIETGKTDIYFEYYTNMSGFHYKGKNVLELIEQFPNGHIVGSVDTMGKRAEYIRYGTIWSNVEKQREFMLTKHPKVNFILQPVISNMNIYTLPDFHLDWFNKGFVRKDNVRYIPLEEPEEMNITVMPVKLKDDVSRKYEGYLVWLSKEKSTEVNKVTPVEKVNMFLAEMRKPSIRTEDEFKLFVAKQNITRKLKFKEIFTEFA